MDAVLLSRIQFGVNAGFHFLFPPTTFGLTLMILILETLFLKTREEIYRNVSNLLVKILGVVFVLGTATGIVLEFAFGTNWSTYARMVGDIFGAPLAAEGVFAFFLESVFLGVLVFGRKRVSEKVYWLSAFLVFFGSHLSGLWIIIANSWMQTPAGYAIQGGRAVLTNFFEAAINHSTVIRYIHTIVAGWITGTVVTAGIASWYLLKGKFNEEAKTLLRISLKVFVVIAILQLILGHFHSVQVANTQPEKMAAYEALWETREGASLALFGIPIESQERTFLYIGIPKLLSFLIHFDPNAPVTGLNEFPPDERPPVFLPFISYHIMILLGLYFILIAIIGAFLLAKGTLYEKRGFLKVLLYSIPLPYLADEFGWIGAEVGRQPWVVYKVLRTSDAISVVVPAGQILFSLLMFIVIYLLIFAIGLYVILRIVKKGPTPVAPSGY